MKTQWLVRKRWLAIGLSIMLWVTAGAQADAVLDSITRAADRLVEQQHTDLPFVGRWPNEGQYTGSIVPGLVCAYQITGDEAYRVSAELGGDYILASAPGGNYYGDEAYTLARLSAIDPCDPCDNHWRDVLTGFYQWISDDPCGGTPAYIGWFTTVNPSTAVYYLAHHVVAAYYVEADDRAIWRASLISYLSEVADDTADYPVLSMGVATWALAQTGSGLDSTPVRLPGSGQPYWNGVVLADLPGLLAGHQASSCEPYPGSFFWRFAHDDGDPWPEYPVSGFTEDLSFSVLGLVAAAQAGSSPGGGFAVHTARGVLPYGVYGDGKVYEHIWLGGFQYNYYAGAILRALCALSPSEIPPLEIPLCWGASTQCHGDVDDDCDVDTVDWPLFRDAFGSAYPAPQYNPCADLDRDGDVDTVDWPDFRDNFGGAVADDCTPGGTWPPAL